MEKSNAKKSSYKLRGMHRRRNSSNYAGRPSRMQIYESNRVLKSNSKSKTTTTLNPAEIPPTSSSANIKATPSDHSYSKNGEHSAKREERKAQSTKIQLNDDQSHEKINANKTVCQQNPSANPSGSAIEGSFEKLTDNKNQSKTVFAENSAVHNTDLKNGLDRTDATEIPSDVLFLAEAFRMLDCAENLDLFIPKDAAENEVHIECCKSLNSDKFQNESTRPKGKEPKTLQKLSSDACCKRKHVKVAGTISKEEMLKNFKPVEKSLATNSLLDSNEPVIKEEPLWVIESKHNLASSSTSVTFFPKTNLSTILGGGIGRATSPMIIWQPQIPNKYPGISITCNESNTIQIAPAIPQTNTENYQQPERVINLVDIPPPKTEQPIEMRAASQPMEGGLNVMNSCPPVTNTSQENCSTDKTFKKSQRPRRSRAQIEKDRKQKLGKQTSKSNLPSDYAYQSVYNNLGNASNEPNSSININSFLSPNNEGRNLNSYGSCQQFNEPSTLSYQQNMSQRPQSAFGNFAQERVTNSGSNAGMQHFAPQQQPAPGKFMQGPVGNLGVSNAGMQHSTPQQQGRWQVPSASGNFAQGHVENSRSTNVLVQYPQQQEYRTQRSQQQNRSQSGSYNFADGTLGNAGSIHTRMHRFAQQHPSCFDNFAQGHVGNSLSRNARIQHFTPQLPSSFGNFLQGCVGNSASRNAGIQHFTPQQQGRSQLPSASGNFAHAHLGNSRSASVGVQQYLQQQEHRSQRSQSGSYNFAYGTLGNAGSISPAMQHFAPQQQSPNLTPYLFTPSKFQTKGFK